MRILVIDTATQALSIALFDDADLIGHFHAVVGRGHAEALLPAIAGLPGGGRADRIAVDVGPGSFTGVRIGLAAARALGMAWGAAVDGYSAMTLIAAMAARDHDAAPIAVTITGGHGELFWQCFDSAGHAPLAPLASTPIATLAQSIESDTFYGTGAEALVTARGRGTAVSLYPDAACYRLIAAHSVLAPRPIYGRDADAKPMAAPVTP